MENEKNAKKEQQQTYVKSLSFIESYFMKGRIQENARERLKDMELVKVNDELVPEVFFSFFFFLKKKKKKKLILH